MDVASESIARVVFERSPDAIFVESLDGTILEVNPAACRLHRTTRENLVGRSVFDLVPPDQQKAVRDQFPLLARGQIDRYEGYSWTVDGQAVPIELQSNRISYHGEPALLLVVRDISDRVESADELRRERDLLSGIINATPLAIFVLNAAGEITFASDQAEQLLRLKRDQMEGRRYTDPVFVDYELDGRPLKTEERPAYQVLNLHRSVRDRRLMVKWPDGQTRRLSVNGSPLKDSNGATTGGVFVVDDVTEDDRMLQELQENRERLELAMDAAKMGMWDWNVETDEVVFNEAWPRLLGYELDEIEPGYETWAQSLHPEDRDAAIGDLERHVRGESGVYRSQFRMRHRDGTWLWFGSIGHIVDRDSNAAPRRVVGLDYNIDEAKRSEIALRASEQRYRELVTSIDPIVWELKLPEWEFTFVSGPQAERILGYPAERWYGSIDTWLRWIDERDRHEVQDYCSNRTEAGEDHEMVYRMRAADGRLVWIRDVVGIVRDGTGKAVGLRGVMIDITDAMTHSEQLNSLLNELNHRVRNNLVALLSLVELYGTGDRSAEDLADALRGQIGAMAEAHNQIAASHGEPISLRSLIESLGRELISGPSPRLSVRGPACEILAARVAPITIMLQEWLTNARKHGALKTSEGRVDLSWEVGDCEPGGECLSVEWIESGGPQVTPPGELGVGLTLVRGFAGYELGGTCDYEFASEGFRCRVCLPGVASDPS